MRSIWAVLSIVVLIFFSYLSFSVLIPSKSSKIEVGKAKFSTKNALEHVKIISKKPHYAGSEAHKDVRNYLIGQLKKLKLEVEVQEGFKFSYGDTVLDKPKNIIGRLKGSGDGKSLVLLSHYDSAMVPSYGASDAGSGVATILESIRAYLKAGNTPKNDIIIVFSDTEEISLDGARLFVNEHRWAKNAALVLNFEARGTSGPSNTILETNQGNSNLVKEFANANPKFPMASSLIYSVYKLLPNNTDSTVFREDGDIDSFFFAFIDGHYNYHTSLDTYENLNRNSLKHQGSYLLPLLIHFAQIDLSQLKTEKDDVFFNFPFIKIVHYPFSWILPLAIIATLLFIGLIFLGFLKNRLQWSIVLKGFLPFLLALIFCGLLGFYGWQFINWLYPQYSEIQQGFTYNGDNYIGCFVFLSLAILFKTYRGFCRKEEIASLYVAPLIFWLLINIAIALYIKGAGFFIIPVYFGLISFAILLFKHKPNILAMSLLAFPTIALIIPLIKFFPIALGLKMLVISCVFTVLAFTLLLPIFGFYRIKNILTASCLLIAIGFFVNAHFQSTFSDKRPKPNSLIYFENATTNNSYWLTYDKNLDSWSKEYLGENPSAATKNISSVSYSKYGRFYTFANPTNANPQIKSFNIKLNKDSIFGNYREVTFTVLPQRRINQLNLYASVENYFEEISFNGITGNKYPIKSTKTKKTNNLLVRYIVSDNDSLKVRFKITKNQNVKFTIQEYSFDLMTNKAFTISERPQNTMPKPFVITDAIVVEKQFNMPAFSEKNKIENTMSSPLQKSPINQNSNNHE